MTDTGKSADIVLALVSALTARGGGPITRDEIAETVAHVADFRREFFDRAGFDALLDHMYIDDEIEILGHPEQITVGRKARWLHALRAGSVTDGQLGYITRLTWGWCVAGEPCPGCGNPLCAGWERE